MPQIAPAAPASITSRRSRTRRLKSNAPEALLNYCVLLGPGLLLVINVARIQELHPILAGLHLGAITGLISLLAIFAAKPDKTLKPIMAFTQTKIYIMLIAIALLSIPGAVWPGASFRSFMTGVPIKCLLFYAMLRVVQKEEDFILLNRVLVYSVSLVAVLSFFTTGKRFNVGSTYDANDLGLIFCSVFPLSYYLSRISTGISKISSTICTVLIVIGIVSTVSRGAFISICIVAPYTLLRDKTLGKVKALAMIGVIVVLFFAFVSESQMERFSTILEPTEDYNYTSGGGRIEIWKRGMNIYLENPILGIGFDGFVNADGTQHQYGAWKTAHNFLIQIAAELGTGGLVLFLALIYTSYKELYSFMRKDSFLQEKVKTFSIGLEASFHAYVITAMFLSQAYSSVFLYLVVCTMILSRINIMNRKASGTRREK
ncbi:O-antigen ligase family protein [Fundidesulfovibrio terrae]|uniref:O-antigen ligase family protein n=1 Tax=Fundidesulfovibrio terrae TaxID=2922866 RepID=UPI001FAF46E9|nr:O-antigen ligase family protein [Fundidesulfovibrio terrae]